MFSEIQLEQKEDYEYDLEGIDLANHFLMIDSYEGNYIYYDIYRFIINNEFFITESLCLIEESESCPPIILKLEQKIEIQNIINNFN